MTFITAKVKSILIKVMVLLLSSVICLVVGYFRGDSAGYDRRVSEDYEELVRQVALKNEKQAEIDKLTTDYRDREEEFKIQLANAKEIKYVEVPVEQSSDSACNVISYDIMQLNASRGYGIGTPENPRVRPEDAAKATTYTEQDLIKGCRASSELYELWRIRYEALVKKVDAAGCYEKELP